MSKFIKISHFRFFFFLQLFKNRNDKMQNLNMTWDFGRTVNCSMAGRDIALSKNPAMKGENVNAKLHSFLQKNIGIYIYYVL